MQSRRIALFALPLVLSFYQVACVDDPTPTPTGPTTDSGVVDAGVHDSGHDATVVADAGADAQPLSDAGVDAPPDASVAGVTVSVTSSTGPSANVLVVYGDSSGAVLATETTSAAGLASHVVPAGSQVTVLLGAAPQLRLTTILAVAPGDTLTVVDDTSASQGFTGSLQIESIPPSAPVGTALFVASIGSCSSELGSAPATVSLQGDCVSKGHFPVLLEALDDSAKPIGFAFLKSGDLATDGGIPSVAIPAPWVTTTTKQSVTTTNVPADLTVSTGYSEVTAGVSLQSSRLAGGAALVPDVTSDFVEHLGYPDFVQREVGVQRSVPGGGRSVTAIAERAAPPSADGTSTYDLATLLPNITGVTLDRTSVTRPLVTFTSASPLTAADGAIARLTFRQTDDAGQPATVIWTIVAPASATSIATPLLPAAAAAWTPSDQAQFEAPSLAFVDATFVAGYPAARAGFGTIDPTANLSRNITTNVIPPLPVAGTLRISGYTPPVL